MPALRDRPRSPDEFIVAFHEIVRAREGRITRGSVRWSPNSTVIRFRLFIRTLRATPGHRLHEAAISCQWSTVVLENGDVLIAGKKRKPTLIPRQNSVKIS